MKVKQLSSHSPPDPRTTAARRMHGCTLWRRVSRFFCCGGGFPGRVMQTALQQLPLVAAVAFVPSPYHIIAPAALLGGEILLCSLCGPLSYACRPTLFNVTRAAQTALGLYLRRWTQTK